MRSEDLLAYARADKAARKDRVAIIGSGLSSGFARQACRDLGIGCDVIILGDVPDLPAVPGAVMLHALPKSIVPYAGLPHEYVLLGTGSEEDYIAKQWGEEAIAAHPRDGQFKHLPQSWRVWTPGQVWSLLWAPDPLCRFVPALKPLTDPDLLRLGDSYGLVLHTFPTAVSKKSQPVPANYAILEYTLADPLPGILPYLAIYNGNRKVGWSRLFFDLEHLSFEFTVEASKTIRNGAPHGRLRHAFIFHPSTRPWTKPLADNIQPIGRWATWDHRKNSFDAYVDVFDLLEPGNKREDLLQGDRLT